MQVASCRSFLVAVLCARVSRWLLARRLRTVVLAAGARRAATRVETKGGRWSDRAQASEPQRLQRDTSRPIICNITSFRLQVPAKHQQMFLRSDFSPEGLVFRRFRVA
ncbi:hypothetical protein MSG28_000289 [Choristoneura fumiferana]|uniref:Uncharacterized protein n=1 Tax=Choristoneura fumiferana TaxID=7141 RepID=A0ACC0K030_CHOFU|nr:hypothetical protein MSG28_000289 [Choristoneura fumiferana]